jgi:hypothetical protein
MIQNNATDAVASLRQQVQQLRGRLPKARLRDLEAGQSPDGRDAQGRQYLTIHEVAARLHTTAAEAARQLAKVEMRMDLNGVPVVEEGRFSQVVLDLAEGKNPSRFL